MGLNKSNVVMTPAEYGGLPKDKQGIEAQESWSYRSVLGIMLYLCNTRPDIQFAVSQCARLTADPRRSHKIALKCIRRYMKGTKEQGLVLKPDDALKIKLFVDADFAGLHGLEKPEDPTSVKRCTGFVICIAKCPVTIWVSRLQTKTALSMAKYIALSTAMRDLKPFKHIAEEVCTYMGLSKDNIATIQTKTMVQEDNNGAMILAKLPPGRSTLKSKFFNVKYHWFRRQLNPEQIRVVKVASDEQLGDILPRVLEKKNLWTCIENYAGGEDTIHYDQHIDAL
jgi:hypothetical protein